MNTLPLGASGLAVPPVAVGCMRLDALDAAQAERFLRTALDLGLNFFDHADIYGDGACESRFAEALGLSLSSDLREHIFLQSKCGIEKRDGRTVGYNFSKAYLLRAVDGILKRLKTDYLDVLVLHRPDALADPAEVAEAFDTLLDAGKVHHFGVSNQTPAQMGLLQKYLRRPLVVDQLQVSVTNCGIIEAGLNANMDTPAGIDRDGGVLDYCRLHGITIQAWSPLQHGFFGGSFIGSEKYPELNQALSEIGSAHGITPAAAAIAWLLRHPACIQPVVGTTDPAHLTDLAKAAEVTLTREEWYKIYQSAGHPLP